MNIIWNFSTQKKKTPRTQKARKKRAERENGFEKATHSDCQSSIIISPLVLHKILLVGT